MSIAARVINRGERFPEETRKVLESMLRILRDGVKTDGDRFGLEVAWRFLKYWKYRHYSYSTCHGKQDGLTEANAERAYRPLDKAFRTIEPELTVTCSNTGDFCDKLGAVLERELSLPSVAREKAAFIASMTKYGLDVRVEIPELPEALPKVLVVKFLEKAITNLKKVPERAFSFD